MADQTQPEDDLADLSYEAAKEELTSIVARLEGGQVGLEESLALWQRAERLAEHCEAWLTRAEAQLSGAAKDADA
jgi:exodeoxyribonuclease VII small subunit